MRLPVSTFPVLVRARVDRKTLEKQVGGLQWASVVVPFLRPWLAPFYRCINGKGGVHDGRQARVSPAMLKAAKLWQSALQQGPLLLHCCPRIWCNEHAAADAWAAGDRAGFGGWWLSDPEQPWWTCRWFSFELSATDLRKWAPIREDLQSEIAWCEMLAQVVLLALRGREGLGLPVKSKSRQKCDNEATVGAAKLHLCWALGLYCLVCVCMMCRSKVAEHGLPNVLGSSGLGLVATGFGPSGLGAHVVIWRRA